MNEITNQAELLRRLERLDYSIHSNGYTDSCIKDAIAALKESEQREKETQKELDAVTGESFLRISAAKRGLSEKDKETALLKDNLKIMVMSEVEIQKELTALRADARKMAETLIWEDNLRVPFSLEKCRESKKAIQTAHRILATAKEGE